MFFFLNPKFLRRTKIAKKKIIKNALLLVFNIRNTQFDQSSPVQPLSEFRGGGSERYKARKTENENPCV